MRVLLGTRKGLIILERAGGSWKIGEHAYPGAPISYAWRDERTGTLWAAASHGHWGTKLYRRRNGGDWEEVEGPRFPEGYKVREETDASVQYIWSMAGGGADNPDRIYIGTVPGGLFVSNDGGDSFELVESLWNHPTREKGWFGGGFGEVGIHSVLVDPRNNDRYFVGISCAGVFETTDNARTWHIRNTGMNASFLPDPDAEVGFDPHRVLSCPSNPDVFWQQNHEGIYRSDDACRSWHRVDQGKEGPAYFGFAVAVDENDADTAWVVPAESDQVRAAIDGGLRVCRTTDGGASWQEFTNGLPQENCLDLVFRHCLDQRNGHVAFGTTTGNIFVSDDRGENWETAAWTLPPVYAVQLID